ncbi:unnamed protein product [Boreogadus saida]
MAHFHCRVRNGSDRKGAGRIAFPPPKVGVTRTLPYPTRHHSGDCSVAVPKTLAWANKEVETFVCILGEEDVVYDVYVAAAAIDIRPTTKGTVGSGNATSELSWAISPPPYRTFAIRSVPHPAVEKRHKSALGAWECPSIYTSRLARFEYGIRVLEVYFFSPDLNWNVLRTQILSAQYGQYGYWNTALVSHMDIIKDGPQTGKWPPIHSYTKLLSGAW